MVVSIYKEKREAIRVRSIHLLSYSCMDDQALVIDLGMARTLNISENGLLIEVHREIAAGSQLEISLTVPDECITLQGVVVRSEYEDRRWRIAVDFNPMPYEMEQKLKYYLDNNFPYTRYN